MAWHGMVGRPSIAQMEKLVEFLESNPQLARGQMRCTMGRYIAKTKWEEISVVLNSMEGVKKETRLWTRFWTDKKYSIKRKLAARRGTIAYHERYGLDNQLAPLSELDERILNLVGSKETDFFKSMELSANNQEGPEEHDEQDTAPTVADKATQTPDYMFDYAADECGAMCPLRCCPGEIPT